MTIGNQKCRVLIDARLFQSGGIGTYIRGVCRNIDLIWNPDQYDAHVLCTSTDVDIVRAYVSEKNMHICDAISFSVSEQFALHRCIKTMQPDLFFSPHVNAPLFSVLCGWYKKTTFIACVHDTFMFGDEVQTSFKACGNTSQRILYALKKYTLRALFRVFVKHARICSVSETSAKRIHALFLCSVRVLHPILPVASYLSKDKDIDIICIGHVGSHKRIQWAIKHAKVSSIVWIGGTISDDRVFGYVHVSENKKNELIARSGALVFPSIAEGFGLPPLEALRAGVPVVISDIPTHREIYGSGPGVYFFTVDDVEDMNMRIQEALSMHDTTGISVYWRKKFVEKELVDEYRAYMCCRKFQ